MPSRAQINMSIVIPAYNEAARLPGSLKKITAYLQTLPGSNEIILIDDGSHDRTEEVARQAIFPVQGRVLVNRRNRGKGAAIRRGMAAARGEWILFTDSDLSTPIEELATLRAAAETQAASVAIGSRALPESRVRTHQPFYRELMGKTFNRFVQWLLLPGLHDTQCGFKLFSRAASRAIFCRMTIPGFGFDAEILYLARRLGWRVLEVPVEWHHAGESKVSPLRDSWCMFWDLLRIRRRHAGGPSAAPRG